MPSDPTTDDWLSWAVQETSREVEFISGEGHWTSTHGSPFTVNPTVDVAWLDSRSVARTDKVCPPSASPVMR